MGPSVVFLLMPALACARLSVHITASPNNKEAAVSFNGTDNNVISDVEKESFNLTSSALKAAVKAYVGGTPLDVFVKSPTPWGDLYKTYKWSEVNRETEIKKAKIVAVKAEKVTLAKQSYKNKLTSGDGVFTADMKADVVNYAKNSYSGNTVSVDVEYNVDLTVGLNPPMHLTLVSHLGANNKFVKDAKKIQADTEVKFTLKPSQSAKAILNATKVTMVVSIDFESDLNGSVAANYNPTYQGHHFWAYDVKELMKAAGAETVQKGTDLVTIQYFTNAFVYVIDESTGNTIVSEPADYVL